MKRGLKLILFVKRESLGAPGIAGIGTAVRDSTLSIDVPFTAPANNGGSAITHYTATSNPGSITGTLNQAGSGTIVVAGLAVGTAYTFTVTATNAIGTGSASSASNSLTTSGTMKAIFGYGTAASDTSLTNLVSNAGVVANDTTGVGTARQILAAAGYGNDKSIFGYGYIATYSSLTNLVSNVGVVANDTTGVGTARRYLAAACYGGDKAIFGFGSTGSVNALIRE
jgi:hypothetical protein